MEVLRIGGGGIGCDPIIQRGNADGNVLKGLKGCENDALLEGGPRAAIEEIESGSPCSSSLNQWDSTGSRLYFGGVILKNIIC